MKTTLSLLSIATFILIGVSCTKDKTPAALYDCPTTISFATTIKPMIDANCISCHGTGGTAPAMTNYSEISNNATAISGTLKGTPQLMPLGGPALADSLINKFDCWIQQGKLEN
jgi:hypothetical protein